MNEVLVTGIGVVSPVGCGWDSFATAVREKRVGIGDLTLFAPPGVCEHAAEVDEYDWKEYLFTKQTYADRCTELAVGAARMCLEHGGLTVPIEPSGPDTGLVFGTEWGCIDSCERFYEPVGQGNGKRASSLVFSHSYPNCPTSFIAIELGLRGYSTSYAGSGAAGLWALRNGADAIALGTAERVVAGGADAVSLARFAHAEARNGLPATGGRPVPQPDDEDGYGWAAVPGEGAVFFLLESSESASRRGVAALAMVADAESDAPVGSRPVWWYGDAGAAGGLLHLARALAAGETASVAAPSAGNVPCSVVLQPAA